MTAKTATETATWVRVRLSADHGMTEGELVLRADRVSVGEDHLEFLIADEVVYRLERRYFRALTWFVDRPTFGEWLRARRAQFPASHTRWTVPEIERLADEVAAGMQWSRIAQKHGRTVSAVKRQAALHSNELGA